MTLSGLRRKLKVVIKAARLRGAAREAACPHLLVPGRLKDHSKPFILTRIRLKYIHEVAQVDQSTATPIQSREQSPGEGSSNSYSWRKQNPATTTPSTCTSDQDVAFKRYVYELI